VRKITSTFAAVLLAFALTTSADEGDAVKSSQPPYKPGRQLDDGNSGGSGALEPAGNSAEPVKSAGAPYKPGRQAEEPPDAGTASKK